MSAPNDARMGHPLRHSLLSISICLLLLLGCIPFALRFKEPMVLDFKDDKTEARIDKALVIPRYYSRFAVYIPEKEIDDKDKGTDKLMNPFVHAGGEIRIRTGNATGVVCIWPQTGVATGSALRGCVIVAAGYKCRYTSLDSESKILLTPLTPLAPADSVTELAKARELLRKKALSGEDLAFFGLADAKHGKVPLRFSPSDRKLINLFFDQAMKQPGSVP